MCLSRVVLELSSEILKVLSLGILVNRSIVCSSPVHAEALADRQGLILAVERGYQNIIIESDSLQIIAVVQDSSTNLEGLIVEDAKALARSISGASSSHVRHQANEVAHRLARVAILNNGVCTWFEEPPVCHL